MESLRKRHVSQRQTIESGEGECFEPSADAALRNALRDEDASIRLTAACLLGANKEPSGLNELREAVLRLDARSGEPRPFTWFNLRFFEV